MAGDQAAAHLAPIETAEEGSKTLTTANVVEQLVTVPTVARLVRIRAKDANTGNIIIGFNKLTSSNGSIVLAAGEAVNISVDDLQKINLYSTVDAEGVTYTRVRA